MGIDRHTVALAFVLSSFGVLLIACSKTAEIGKTATSASARQWPAELLEDARRYAAGKTWAVLTTVARAHPAYENPDHPATRALPAGTTLPGQTTVYVVAMRTSGLCPPTGPPIEYCTGKILVAEYLARSLKLLRTERRKRYPDLKTLGAPILLIAKARRLEVTTAAGHHTKLEHGY